MGYGCTGHLFLKRQSPIRALWEVKWTREVRFESQNYTPRMPPMQRSRSPHPEIEVVSPHIPRPFLTPSQNWGWRGTKVGVENAENMGYGGARNVVDLPFVAPQRLVWFGFTDHSHLFEDHIFPISHRPHVLLPHLRSNSPGLVFPRMQS